MSDAVAHSEENYVALIVPKHLVKRVKTVVEKHGSGQLSAKIRPHVAERGLGTSLLGSHSERFLLPTSIVIGGKAYGFDEARRILEQDGLADEVELTTIQFDKDARTRSSQENGLDLAVRDWAQTLPLKDEHGHPARSVPDNLVASLPSTYSVYGQMLLLPAQTFQASVWQTCLANATNAEKHQLFSNICQRLQVTHIASNAPIPLLQSAKSTSESSSDENILRSPTNLTPLHGDFGPLCSTTRPPTAADFAAAFWVSAKQNGIIQSWAPRYTMFSRGNITEKARILHHPSVQLAITQGLASGTGCSAVDLYAGIGYFAFSYAAAGVAKILCWDLNAWSIEGLRRGAQVNKWRIAVCSPGSNVGDDGSGEMDDAELVRAAQEARFLAFVESNDYALSRIRRLREHVPPIRHVNCGLLPTSRGCWATAVEALDRRLGGWVHVHENFAIAEIETKAEAVRTEFERLVVDLDQKWEDGMVAVAADDSTARLWRGKVVVEHVQRVKSYAPGVFHCVVDIYIPAAEAT